MSYTYTYAILEVSEACYREIADRLRMAGYESCFEKDGNKIVIDMHGIALASAPTAIERGRELAKKGLP
jgi:hypothetical protein